MRIGLRRSLLLLCLTPLFLVACGGGSEDQTSTGSPGGGSNAKPQIGGSPLSSIAQGMAYSFIPSASGGNGHALSFSVSNLPGWASFVAGTGELRGRPSSNDVGVYPNIQITVSDGTDSTTLGPFNIEVVGTATGSAFLSWTPPTQNTDGSALTDLTSYKIYWGAAAGNYPNAVTVDAGLASYMIEQLTPATWYFVATAINSSGVESSFSNPASKAVQ